MGRKVGGRLELLALGYPQSWVMRRKAALQIWFRLIRVYSVTVKSASNEREKAEQLHCMQNWPIPACNRLAQCSYTPLSGLVGPWFVFIFIPVSAFTLPGLYFIVCASLDWLRGVCPIELGRAQADPVQRVQIFWNDLLIRKMKAQPLFADRYWTWTILRVNCFIWLMLMETWKISEIHL